MKGAEFALLAPYTGVSLEMALGLGSVLYMPLEHIKLRSSKNGCNLLAEN